MSDKWKTPGKFAVQFGTDAQDRLDFTVRTCDTLDEALGVTREAIATHPEFNWDCVIIWKDRTAEDLYNATTAMQEDIDRED